MKIKKKIIRWVKKNKGFTLLYTLFVLGFLLDLITTSLSYEYLDVLEMNPLYSIFNGLWGIVLANIIVLYLLVRWYEHYNKNREHKMTFWIMGVMLFIILLRLYASYNALQWYETPPTAEQIEVLAQTTVEQKANFYFVMIGVFAIPLLFAQLVFLCWQWDHLPKKRKKVLK